MGRAKVYYIFYKQTNIFISKRDKHKATKKAARPLFNYLNLRVIILLKQQFFEQLPECSFLLLRQQNDLSLI